MENNQAIVIGSGIGGIASAIRLAVKGYQVKVLEANAYPGGKLTQIRTKGYRFDAGPSLFTLPELVDELFELAGKNPKDYFHYSRLSILTHYFYEDGLHLKSPANPEDFAKEVAEKTSVSQKQVIKHLKKSAFIYRISGKLFLRKSLHRWQTYASFGTLFSTMMLPILPIFQSLHQLNKKAFGDKRLTQLFNRYATYNGSNPYQAPGMLHIIPYLEFMKGAYLPENGMHDITQSLVKLAQELGVEFCFDEAVSKIRTNGNQVCGVESIKRKLDANLVVCNSDVRQVYQHLLPNAQRLAKVDAQERSSSALIFYWGIRRSFPSLDLHNIFFSKDYKKEFDSIFKQREMQDDPTVYVNITSKFVQADAPENCENWFVMINTSPNQGQDWESWTQDARKRIIAKLNRMLDTNLEEYIEVEEILDPVKIESKTSSYQGSLYGTSSNDRLAAFFRHPNFSSDYKGLYFVGGSVHPGGGIPLAISSAKIMDQLITPAT